MQNLVNTSCVNELHGIVGRFAFALLLLRGAVQHTYYAYKHKYCYMYIAVHVELRNNAMEPQVSEIFVE